MKKYKYYVSFVRLWIQLMPLKMLLRKQVREFILSWQIWKTSVAYFHVVMVGNRFSNIASFKNSVFSLPYLDPYNLSSQSFHAGPYIFSEFSRRKLNIRGSTNLLTATLVKQPVIQLCLQRVMQKRAGSYKPMYYFSVSDFQNYAVRVLITIVGAE